MARISRMDQASNRVRSFWRFSLRELFLLMLVVAAFLGWGTTFFHYYFWRYEPSSLVDRNQVSDWGSDIYETWVELGELAPERVAQTITSNGGTWAAQQTMYFRFSFPAAKRRAFMDVYLKRVQARIKAAAQQTMYFRFSFPAAKRRAFMDVYLKR